MKKLPILLFCLLPLFSLSQENGRTNYGSVKTVPFKYEKKDKFNKEPAVLPIKNIYEQILEKLPLVNSLDSKDTLYIKMSTSPDVTSFIKYVKGAKIKFIQDIKDIKTDLCYIQYFEFLNDIEEIKGHKAFVRILYDISWYWVDSDKRYTNESSIFDVFIKNGKIDKVEEHKLNNIIFRDPKS